MLTFSVLCFSIFVASSVGTCQVAQPPERVEPGQHGEHGKQEHHHLHMVLGEEKCDPQFTYEEGPHGPSHWPGLCNAGKMQAPIDIQHAENGQRPRMSIQLVHFSPEGVFLIIEVPVVAGKENPVIKTLWEHIPAPGKENKVDGVKINPTDLLPADHSFYRFPGSLTTPICNEVVYWYVMKNPIELSEAQIAEYAKYYHNAARPLQPLDGRPVTEPQETLP